MLCRLRIYKGDNPGSSEIGSLATCYSHKLFPIRDWLLDRVRSVEYLSMEQMPASGYLASKIDAGDVVHGEYGGYQGRTRLLADGRGRGKANSTARVRVNVSVNCGVRGLRGYSRPAFGDWGWEFLRAFSCRWHLVIACTVDTL